MSKTPTLFLHASTLLTPALALALGFRRMPRISPAGSRARLCTRCYPRCPWAPHPQSPPTSPAFPPPAPAKLGEVLRREAPAEGAAGAPGGCAKWADAPPRPPPPPGEPRPGSGCAGNEPQDSTPIPFFNLSAPALSPLTWAAGAPKRGPGRCGRPPKFAGGGRGQIPLELKRPGCAVRSERSPGGASSLAVC